MKYYTFDIIVQKEPEDPGYYAYSPQLPGCFSAGDTVEETIANMREAIEVHVSVMVEDGVPIPQRAQQDVRLGELTVAIPA